jgi:hypothetical protein
MEVTYGSKGYIPTTTGSYVTVLTVPAGYHCKVTYFLAAASGSITVDARWSDGSDYSFLHAKNMNAGDLVEFGGSEGKFLVMSENETLDIKCSSVNAVFIISYELYIAPASNIVL